MPLLNRSTPQSSLLLQFNFLMIISLTFTWIIVINLLFHLKRVFPHMLCVLNSSVCIYRQKFSLTACDRRSLLSGATVVGLYQISLIQNLHTKFHWIPRMNWCVCVCACTRTCCNYFVFQHQNVGYSLLSSWKTSFWETLSEVHIALAHNPNNVATQNFWLYF